MLLILWSNKKVVMIDLLIIMNFQGTCMWQRHHKANLQKKNWHVIFGAIVALASY